MTIALLSLVVMAAVIRSWSCGGTPTFVPTISQGLYGRVVLYQGNCMPGAGECKVSHPSRKVFIHRPATVDDISEERSKHLVRPVELVATTTANHDGFYEVSLAPGTYSVFVEDDGKESCTFFDGGPEACKVMVGDGLTEPNLRIDRAAW